MARGAKSVKEATRPSPRGRPRRPALGAVRRGLVAQARAARLTPAELRAWPDALDRELRAAWRAVLAELSPEEQKQVGAEAALLATGAYGLRQASPFEAVEVVVLLAGEGRALLERAAHELFEALRAAITDEEVALEATALLASEAGNLERERLTALLDARLVAGSAPLFKEAGAALVQHLDLLPFVSELVAEWTERRGGVEATPFAAEPSIANGPGGLRDLRVMRWLAVACHRVSAEAAWDQLAARGALSKRAAEALTETEEYLLALRAALEGLAGSAASAVTRAQQEPLATLWQQPSAAAMMAEGYARLEGAARTAERFAAQTRHRRFPMGSGLAAAGGVLGLVEAEAFRAAPGNLVRAHQLAQVHGLALHTDLMAAMNEWVDEGPHADRAARERFVALLRMDRVAATVREMAASGVLGWLLPEWAKLRVKVAASPPQPPSPVRRGEEPSPPGPLSDERRGGATKASPPSYAKASEGRPLTPPRARGGAETTASSPSSLRSGPSPEQGEGPEEAQRAGDEATSGEGEWRGGTADEGMRWTPGELGLRALGALEGCLAQGHPAVRAAWGRVEAPEAVRLALLLQGMRAEAAGAAAQHAGCDLSVVSLVAFLVLRQASLGMAGGGTRLDAEQIELTAAEIPTAAYLDALLVMSVVRREVRGVPRHAGPAAIGIERAAEEVRRRLEGRPASAGGAGQPHPQPFPARGEGRGEGRPHPPSPRLRGASPPAPSPTHLRPGFGGQASGAGEKSPPPGPLPTGWRGGEPSPPDPLSDERRGGSDEGEVSAEAIEAHAATMPASYLYNTPWGRLGAHVRAADRARAGAPVLEFRAEAGGTELFLCTRDEATPGLLSRVAGVLYAHHVNIHAAQVYTRREPGPLALDTLHLDVAGKALSEAKQAELAAEVPPAVRGALEMEHYIREGGRPVSAPIAVASLAVRNAPEEEHTLVELVAQDREGLLFFVTRALARRGLHIVAAKVTTWAGWGRDAFYVVEGTGARLLDAKLAGETAALRAAIESG